MKSLLPVILILVFAMPSHSQSIDKNYGKMILDTFNQLFILSTPIYFIM